MTGPQYAQQPYGQPQPQHYPQPPKKRKVWPWILLATIPAFLFVGCVASIVDATSDAANTTTTATAPPYVIPRTVAPVISATPAPPPAPKGPASTISKDGVYLVGVDIQPGTWRATGGSSCYWERKADLTGGIGSILDNGLGAGQQVVTVLPSDRAFEVKRCGTWALIPD